MFMRVLLWQYIKLLAPTSDTIVYDVLKPSHFNPRYLHENVVQFHGIRTVQPFASIMALNPD